MQRWTIRNVKADAIRAVQELSAVSGVCLGQIVSECIELGIDQVRRRLLDSSAATEPASMIGSDLDKIFRSIKLLSDLRPNPSGK